MLPERLINEVDAISKEGIETKLIEAEGMANIIFANYPFPWGYNRSSTDLLLRIPLSYPNGQPDMFWVEPDLTLVGGGVPKSAENIETYLGRQWRRFSWHLTSWNPSTCDLRTFLEFINARVAKGV